MRNIKLLLEYDGTSYSGWQRQKHGSSIQGKIEQILSQILNKSIKLISAGRTDAGVHAKEQVANFKINSTLPVEKIKIALNSLLPLDIRVKHASLVDLDFHARYCAKRKIYRYYIYTGYVVSPFMHRYVWHLPLMLDFDRMNEETKFLKGKHDFSCFKVKKSSVKDCVREIFRADLKKKGRLFQFEIEADGYLYKMVRKIVGTLVNVGRGKLAPGIILSLLEERNGLKPGPTAPAKGLFLWKVIY